MDSRSSHSMDSHSSTAARPHQAMLHHPLHPLARTLATHRTPSATEQRQSLWQQQLAFNTDRWSRLNSQR